MLGISVDSVEENRAFAEKFDYPFRLLSDPTREVSLAYGAVASADDQYAARYTYVLGADGTIEQAIDTADPGGQAAALLESF